MIAVPSTTPVGHKLHRHIRVMVFLTLCGILIFFSTLRSPFLYDDQHAIVHNQYTQSFEHFKKVFTFGDILNRNVLLFTFALNRETGGLDALGYHLVNLLMHLCAGIVFYFLARELLNIAQAGVAHQNIFALLAATVHILHPMTVASVAYLSSRSSILATLFYLLGIYFFVRFLKTRNRPQSRFTNLLYPALVLVFFLFGIGTKEIVVTLPLMAVASLWFFNPQEGLRKILPAATLLLLPLFLYLAYRTIVLGGLFRLKAAPIPEMTEQVLYFLTQFKVLLTFYLVKLFLPFNLNFEPDVRLVSGFADPGWMLSLFGLVLLGLVLGIQKSRLITFGFLWALMTVLPTSSLIPLKQVAVEHRTYLAGLGICMVIAALLMRPARRNSRVLWPALALVIFFSGLTLNRTLDYRSRISIWEDAAKKSPNKALVHNNLASAYLDEKRYPDAKRELVKTLELDPDHSEAHINLGHIHAVDENWTEAKIEFDRALVLGSEKPDAVYYSGLMRLHQGKPKEALPFLVKAVERKPEEARYHFDLGNAYKSLGRYDEALQHFRRTLKIQPDHTNAHNNSGVIFWNLKMFDLAETEFKKALAEDQDHPDILNNLTNLYMLQKKYMEAIPHLKRLVQFQPENHKARQLLDFAQANSEVAEP